METRSERAKRETAEREQRERERFARAKARKRFIPEIQRTLGRYR
jgi:hypothetical protein